MGSGEHNDIKLDRNFPENLGQYVLEGEDCYFYPDPSVRVTELSPTRVFEGGKVYPDIAGLATSLCIGPYRWRLIKRNSRYGVRVKDTTLVSRIRFAGINSYPFESDMIVKAEVIQAKENDEVSIKNILGDESSNKVASYLKFKLEGNTYTLSTLGGGPNSYFLIFSDNTNNETTYGGGRYIYVPKPEAGSDHTYIDFNRAINPPCVYTDYATCPLPPRENHIDLLIEAGEKYRH